MNNILLVGANGFIGSFLYKELKKKFPITSIDYSTGAIENDFFTLDLTQKPEIEDFAKKCTQFDTLIFLVGLGYLFFLLQLLRIVLLFRILSLG